jgi:hypothetical protein
MISSAEDNKFSVHGDDPVRYNTTRPMNLSMPLQLDALLKIPFTILNGVIDYFAGICNMIYSESAVIVRLGLTPRLAETTEPSAT